MHIYTHGEAENNRTTQINDTKVLGCCAVLKRLWIKIIWNLKVSEFTD